MFFRSAYEQFQKVDCVWGMESEYNGYNYISSKTPFSVAKPIFTSHSFPAVSKKGISQKNFASADRLFLNSFYVDVYNNVIKKFLFKSKKKEPSKIELAPLHLEESPSEESESLSSSSADQKTKEPLNVDLPPLRLKGRLEPVAKKPRLNEQTKIYVPSAPTAPTRGIRPEIPSAPTVPTRGTRPEIPSAPTAPTRGIRPEIASAPIAPIG